MSLHSSSAARKLTPEECARTERLARIVALAEGIWEDRDDARGFLNQPHPLLDDRTPLDVASTELGARRVNSSSTMPTTASPFDLARRLYRIASRRYRLFDGGGAAASDTARWNSRGRRVILDGVAPQCKTSVRSPCPCVFVVNGRHQKTA